MISGPVGTGGQTASAPGRGGCARARCILAKSGPLATSRAKPPRPFPAHIGVVIIAWARLLGPLVTSCQSVRVTSEWACSSARSPRSADALRRRRITLGSVLGGYAGFLGGMGSENALGEARRVAPCGADGNAMSGKLLGRLKRRAE